jgi:branched-subunit amino acid aminotransferase/4-amino-4-deoxychorismate lyase
MEFILSNGKIIRENEFHPDSEGWTDNLQLKQDMWFAHGEIPHFQQHYSEFTQLLDRLERQVPADVPPPSELHRMIIRLINKNKAFMGGWICLRFMLTEKETQYVVSVSPHPDRLFPLDTAGKTGIFSPFVKPNGNPLSSYFFFSETVWKTERIRSGKKQDEVPLFLNEKGIITEAEGANLFCILNNQVITPSLETGCVVDIMRDYVIQSAKNIGFVVIESVSLVPSALNGMEEIFIVSEGSGFRWLKGIGGKRYFKTGTEQIWRQVNKSSFSTVS